MSGDGKIDAGERLVNLACYLSASSQFRSIDKIRNDVAGYDRDGSDDAFARMFEHDKDMLRSNGLAIVTRENCYKIDPAASFASEMELLPHETAVIRTVGNLALSDPEFPFASDLRLALTKIAGALGGLSQFSSPAKTGSGGSVVSTIQDAVTRSKELSFAYVNSSGGASKRAVHPYGLFRYAGSWYLVAYDPAKNEVRVFNCERMSGLSVNPRLPKSPDFDPVEGFDVASYMGLPFQYGDSEFQAEVLFSPEMAWQASRMAHGHGCLEEEKDGSAVWRVLARSEPRLLRWIISHGPGISPLAPPTLVSSYTDGLARTEALHG